MELKTKAPNVIKQDAKRIKAIKEYIKQQELYQKLYNRCLVSKFTIYKIQIELDIESISDKQQEKLDKCTPEKRDQVLKDLPEHEVEYDAYLIAPFYIGNSSHRTDTCISELDTTVIELINKRTNEEIKDFIHFIK